MEKRESLFVWRVATALIIGFLLIASAASVALGQAVETRIGIVGVVEMDCPILDSPDFVEEIDFAPDDFG